MPVKIVFDRLPDDPSRRLGPGMSVEVSVRYVSRSTAMALERSAAGDHNPWLVAVIVSMATFMEVLDTSIANVSLQHIAGSMAASQERAPGS